MNLKNLMGSVAIIALTLSSCTTIKKTATSIDVANTLTSQSNVDLVVSDSRVTYTYRPVKRERRGGTQNIYNCAVAATLKSYGGEVLVAPEFETNIRTGLFGQKKIREVIVSGYPATYKNFRKEKK